MIYVNDKILLLCHRYADFHSFVMPKKPTNKTNELFRQAVAGISPLKQDKFVHSTKPLEQKLAKRQKRQKQLDDELKALKQASAEFEFSDEFQGHFESIGPLKYTRSDAQTYLVKQLRRGDFPPDLILDLHGYRRSEAKLEVAALIHAAVKEHYGCVCIVHGVGKSILKTTVPSWLIQHPKVLAFHQAPLEWGGQGALLVLIET